MQSKHHPKNPFPNIGDRVFGCSSLLETSKRFSSDSHQRHALTQSADAVYYMVDIILRIISDVQCAYDE